MGVAAVQLLLRCIFRLRSRHGSSGQARGWRRCGGRSL